MRVQGGTLCTSQLAELCGLTVDALDWHLTNLEARGLVRRAGRHGRQLLWIADAPQTSRDFAAVAAARERLRIRREAVLAAKRAARQIQRGAPQRKAAVEGHKVKLSGDYMPRRDPLVAALFGQASSGAKEFETEDT